MNTYSSYNDEQLTAMLKAGDESAFNEIYERYWELLLGMAFNRLRQLPEAEDAVHDVFASLWKTRLTHEISSLKSYLAVSLKYTVLRIVHRKRLFTALEPGSETEIPSVRADLAENRDIVTQLRKEMDKLPEKCRLIFRMSRLEGLSNAEIARELDISNKTVENQINKAQGRLRVSLKNLLKSVFALLPLF